MNGAVQSCGDTGVVHICYEAKKPQNRKFWVVTTQFNPAGYKTIANNYRRFAEHLSSSGVNLMTAELTYQHQRPTLNGRNVLQYQATDVMWHKERLLNLAIDQLPSDCEYVAWVDADIMFTNEYWVEDTIAELETKPVVQMFEKVFMLDPQGNHYKDAYGFAFSLTNGFLDDYGTRYSGYWNGNMKHPGFAWAARKETLKAWGGLYDRHILGGGDFQMALAFVGDRSPDWYSRFGAKFQNHMLSWSEGVNAITKGQLGYTPGCILHMWHGHSEDRQYIERSKCLVESDFDPEADIKEGKHGLWEWASDKPDLHQRVASYFKLRKDDRTFPVFPTRYEDKYPVIMSVNNETDLRNALNGLAAQNRKDFVAWIALADWQQAAKLKSVIRDEYWPFETRMKSAYNKPQKLVPRQYQTVASIGQDSRAKKVIFIDNKTIITKDFVSKCVAQSGVVTSGGSIVSAPVPLVRSPEVQAESECGGMERILAAAVTAGVQINQL